MGASGRVALEHRDSASISARPSSRPSRSRCSRPPSATRSTSGRTGKAVESATSGSRSSSRCWARDRQRRRRRPVRSARSALDVPPGHHRLRRVALAARVRHGSLFPIFAVLVVFGIARAFAAPRAGARHHARPDEHFSNAVSWSSSTWQLASIAGPGMAGRSTEVRKPGTGLPRKRRARGGDLRSRLRARDPPQARGRHPVVRAAAGRLSLRVVEQADPRRDLARPVRGAPRRRGRAAADLREATSSRSGRGASASFAARPAVGAR